MKRVRSEGDNGTATDDDKDVGLRPVCLPSSGLSYNNYTGVVTGWGTTEEGGSVSNALQEVSDSYAMRINTVKIFYLSL